MFLMNYNPSLISSHGLKATIWMDIAPPLEGPG